MAREEIDSGARMKLDQVRLGWVEREFVIVGPGHTKVVGQWSN